MMKKRILFLAACPSGTTPLALDEECRAITKKLRAAEHRDSLELITAWAVRPDDLLQLLNQHTPHVVHFSGHGTPEEELVLLDKDRHPTTVSNAALKQLFRTLKDNIRVVVLNACFSRPQAAAITEVIDCTVGMKRAIGDDAAVTFAAAFYQAIGFGRSIKVAFESGIAALMLDGILEDQVPVLLTRHGIDAAAVFLVEPQHTGVSDGDLVSDDAIRAERPADLRQDEIASAMETIHQHLRARGHERVHSTEASLVLSVAMKISSLDASNLIETLVDKRLLKAVSGQRLELTTTGLRFVTKGD